MMSTQWSASSELDQSMCRAVLINLGTSHFAQLNFLEARYSTLSYNFMARYQCQNNVCLNVLNLYWY